MKPNSFNANIATVSSAKNVHKTRLNDILLDVEACVAKTTDTLRINDDIRTDPAYSVPSGEVHVIRTDRGSTTRK